MSSSGLNWKPIVKAWLKKRSPKEQEVFSKLFDEHFSALHTWGAQNLVFVMDVLECHVIFQIINLLEGLVPTEKGEEVSASKPEVEDEETMEESEKVDEKKVYTPEHLARLFVFALTWGVGAHLETSDRAKCDKFMKEHLHGLDLPINTSKNPEVSK